MTLLKKFKLRAQEDNEFEIQQADNNNCTLRYFRPTVKFLLPVQKSRNFTSLPSRDRQLPNKTLIGEVKSKVREKHEFEYRVISNSLAIQNCQNSNPRIGVHDFCNEYSFPNKNMPIEFLMQKTKFVVLDIHEFESRDL